MEPTLLTSREDAVTTDGEDRGAGVVTVTIHHPEKRNAMTPGMWRQLPPLLKDLAADPGVRVLVLTGAEGTFCAGADIGSLRGTGATGDPALSAGGAAGNRRPWRWRRKKRCSLPQAHPRGRARPLRRWRLPARRRL